MIKYGEIDGMDVWLSREENDINYVWLKQQLDQTYFGGRSVQQLTSAVNKSIFCMLFCFAPAKYETLDGFEIAGPSHVYVPIAFGRVVTDCQTFGWICDVVVDKEIRGHGVGSALMRNILCDCRLSGVTLNLGTRDAHGFYEKFGFVRCEQMMRRPTV